MRLSNAMRLTLSLWEVVGENASHAKSMLCVDGWLALHERFGSLPLADVLAPAIDLAEQGFPASPLLVGSTARLDGPAREQLDELATQATRTGALVRRPGAARTLRSIVGQGRDGFYGGEFASGLLLDFQILGFFVNQSTESPEP